MEKELGRIPCCECASPILPNLKNLCSMCLNAATDLAISLPRQVALQQCTGCQRYLVWPQVWVIASPESRELLAVCLKQLKGLTDFQLVDAAFSQADPVNTKTIKVKLTVKLETVEDVLTVDFTLADTLCPQCDNTKDKDQWNCVVQVQRLLTKHQLHPNNTNMQVRQRGGQLRTLLLLEQFLAKHNVTNDCVSIKATSDGIDFFFIEGKAGGKGKALVEFIQSKIPVRHTQSKKLVSHNVNNDTYNCRSTISVDVVPICRDNVVVLPRQAAHQMGGMGQVVVVRKVSRMLHFIDPDTCQIGDMSATTYYNNPFYPIACSHDLKEFTVMDIQLISSKERKSFSGQGKVSSKHRLADVWVVKSSELGLSENDGTHCRTFLGDELEIGDTVLGLDIRNINVNNSELEKMAKDKIPDVLLVKKEHDEYKDNLHNKGIAHLEGFPVIESDSPEMHNLLADLIKISE